MDFNSKSTDDVRIYETKSPWPIRAGALRLWAFVALFLFIHAGARAGSPMITLSVKNAPIEKVFKSIRKQSGYLFLHTEEVLKNARPVSVHIKESSIEKVLEKCFENQPLSYRISNKTVVVHLAGNKLPAPAPDTESSAIPLPAVRVTGIVVDSASRTPMPGVTIRVKGSAEGAVTDPDGRFSLEIQEKGVMLIVSYVGYSTQEIRASGGDELRIVLGTAISALDQVVVVGYGSVKKRDVTGSVSVIKGSDIESAPVASVDQALQGKAAGVQVTAVNGAPGAATTIRIRGGNSISASNEPLYVIDGFIGEFSLTSINPTDIASIEILKDASATAIYGARGANGVILITTKRGKAGRSNISVNAYTGFQQLPREIDLLNGPQLAEFVNERAELFGAAPIFNDLSKVTTTNWQKAITRSAPMSSANLAFEGGTEKLTYYLSGNYFNQDGIILNSGFQRYQTRLNLDLKLTNWLSVGANMNFNRSNTNNNKVNLYDVLKSAPTTSPVIDENGDYVIVSNLNGGTFENPVAVAKMTLDNTYNNSLLGNWFLLADFKNGLQLKSQLGINNVNAKSKQYRPGALPLRSTQRVGGYAYLSNTQSLNLLSENTISYNKQWGSHQINVLGGFTYQKENLESFTATGQGFANDLLAYNNLATGNPLQASNTSTATEWTIISFLARLNYSLKGKYLFTVTARNDGSSRLSANHKHAFFPSAAFAWQLGEEDFVKNLGWFDHLKVRLTYGKTGNQAIGVYSTLASLSVSNAWFNGVQQTGYALGTLANSNLKWETTDQVDAGIDASLLKGRLSVNLDFYYKKTYNLLLSAQIPGTTGYSSRLQNIGTVQNKGIELTVEGTVLDRPDFTWDLGFNIAANRNKVLDLGRGLQHRELTDGARLIVGKPAPVFYGLVYEGTYKSQEEIDALPTPIPGLKPGFPKFKDVNGNGKYDGVADYDIIGSPEPLFFGGFNTALRYKRVSMNAFFQYTYGNDVVNSFGPRLFMGEYASNVAAQQTGRWTLENNQSDLPRVGSHSVYSVNTQAYSFAVQDGSFLRLKTLQLNYNISSERIKWLKNASIYVTGSNLFLLDRYKWGYDPEVNSNGTNAVLRGFDGYSYPQNRSFIFGINLKL